MRWERSVLALIDDLEQQAEGLHLQERDLEVADRTRAEYAHVAIASRLHALVGRPVRLRLLGGITLAGTVTRTGADWLLVEDATGRAQWCRSRDDPRGHAPGLRWRARTGSNRGRCRHRRAGPTGRAFPPAGGRRC